MVFSSYFGSCGLTSMELGVNFIFLLCLGSTGLPEYGGFIAIIIFSNIIYFLPILFLLTV